MNRKLTPKPFHVDPAYKPYGLVSPAGLLFSVELSKGINDAWNIMLGWPSPEERLEFEKKGYYVVELTVSPVVTTKPEAPQKKRAWRSQ